MLTLAVGHNTALLCKAWCDPREAATTGCHHQEPTASASLSGNDNCDNVVLSTAALVRENVRRGSTTAGTHDAIVVPRFRVAPSTTDTSSGYEPGRELAIERRPLVTTLRI